MSQIVNVPWERIDPRSLESLIESYILREGTDYGLQEVDHQTKVLQLLRQVRQEEILVIFDSTTDSFNLVTKRDFLAAQGEGQ